MDPLRLLIADDDASIRDALRDVLEADDRFAVVGVVDSGEALLALAETLRPDVVLLDVRMPGGGAAAARALLTLPEPAPGPGSAGRTTPPVVVAVSAQTGTSVVVSMLRAGVSGYLVKGRLGALPDLVARCGNGEVVLAVPCAGDALRQVVGAPAEPAAGAHPDDRRS
jgi:DNA-binding NarL/FixJ family response regulator